MKCSNCGSEILITNDHIVKCGYCGKIYSVKEQNVGDEVSDINSLYREAMKNASSSSILDIELAIDYFDLLGDYKDSNRRKQKAIEDKAKIIEDKRKAEENRIQAEKAKENARIESEKRRELLEKSIAKNKRKKRILTLIILLSCVVCIAVAGIIGIGIWGINRILGEKYDKAVRLYSNCNYEQSLDMFSSIKFYRDSKDYIIECNNAIEEQKKHYSKAEEYFNSGDYINAVIEYYNSFPYNDSETKIEECCQKLCSDAKKLEENGDIDGAVKLLETIPSYLISEEVTAYKESLKEKKKQEDIVGAINNANLLLSEEKFEEAIGEIDVVDSKYGSSDDTIELRKAILIAKVLSEVAVYEDEGNLKEAYKKLSNCDSLIKNESDIVSKKSSIKQKYIESTLTLSDEKLHSEGIDAAITILDDSLTVLSGENEIIKMKEYYNSLRPTKFDFMNYIDCSPWQCFKSFDDGQMDIKGNEYPNSICLYWKEPMVWTEATASYKNEGNYDKLTGYFFVRFSDRLENNYDIVEKCSLKVYADGNFVGELEINNTMEAQYFCFDISGASIIEVKFDSEYWRGVNSDYPGQYVYLSDVMLEKNY